MKIVCLATICLLVSLSLGSHIDDINGELSKFSFDEVIFRIQKDCSLDRIPDVKTFLEQDSVKYPKLKIYLSDGEPRFELMKNGELVDTVRVGRYDLSAFKRLMKEFGLERDESYTWKRK